jgi:hypothetical protein
MSQHSRDRTWKSECSFSFLMSSAKLFVLIYHVKMLRVSVYDRATLGYSPRSNRLDNMPLNKQVDIEVLADTWKTPSIAPAPLTSAAQSSPFNIDFFCALLFIALWTRPPIRYGFSLSDCWAWLRYLPALAPTQDLRLCEAWTTLDPHHKTVLSGDFGVGFTTWFLYQTLDFVKFSDTLWVVNSLSPGAFQ